MDSVFRAGIRTEISTIENRGPYPKSYPKTSISVYNAHLCDVRPLTSGRAHHARDNLIPVSREYQIRNFSSLSK